MQYIIDFCYLFKENWDDEEIEKAAKEEENNGKFINSLLYLR